MIFGAHVVIYSKEAALIAPSSGEVDFIRDAGHGWLIFALPPAEVAVASRRRECPARTLFHV
jgi:hypothetical protein